MGMKASSLHYQFSSGAGGPVSRQGRHFKLNIQYFAKMPKQRSQLMHIMRKAEGHLPNSLKNRKILERLSNSEKNFIRKDGNGNKIYSKVIGKKEYWVYERNGIIQNGGVNIKNHRFHKKGGK